MFELRVLTTDKARNSTYQPPIEWSDPINVLLKDDDETSIVRPIFRLRCDYEGAPAPSAISGFNYCYCPSFNRYYYITNIVYITAVIVDLYCEVDVLATYKDAILDTEAFVMYSESQYNSFIPDNRIPVTEQSHMVTNNVNMSATWNLSGRDGAYVITVAGKNTDGKNGMASSFAFSPNQMQQLADKFYQTDVWNEIQKQFANPLQAIINAVWIPTSTLTVSEGSVESVILGEYDTGIDAQRVKDLITETLDLPIHVPYRSWHYADDGVTRIYNYGDYRNLEPYTEYYALLPGVGLTQIPMINCLCSGTEEDIVLSLTYAFHPATGDITYAITQKNTPVNGEEYKYAPVLMCKGNMSIQVPLTQVINDWGGIISSTVSAIGGMTVGLTTLASGHSWGAGYAIKGMADDLTSAIFKAQTASTSVVGSLGGWSGSIFMTDILLITRVFQLAETPNNAASVIGRPLFKKKKLSECSGLVKCTGAYVKATCTNEEHNMIAQFVNSSTNFIYGGLIIE